MQNLQVLALTCMRECRTTFSLFLLKAERIPASSSFDEGAKVPAGAWLYFVNTPLGVISDSGGRITFPLEANARREHHRLGLRGGRLGAGIK
jgi:hypothetical protein